MRSYYVVGSFDGAGKIIRRDEIAREVNKQRASERLLAIPPSLR
jgi:hypothetical protein